MRFDNESYRTQIPTVSWRGRDGYDQFAEEVGATLPRIIDQSTKSSAPATSEGDTECLMITEMATGIAKGEKTCSEPLANAPH